MFMVRKHLMVNSWLQLIFLPAESFKWQWPNSTLRSHEAHLHPILRSMPLLEKEEVRHFLRGINFIEGMPLGSTWTQLSRIQTSNRWDTSYESQMGNHWFWGYHFFWHIPKWLLKFWFVDGWIPTSGFVKEVTDNYSRCNSLKQTIDALALISHDLPTNDLRIQTCMLHTRTLGILIKYVMLKACESANARRRPNAFPQTLGWTHCFAADNFRGPAEVGGAHAHSAQALSEQVHPPDVAAFWTKFQQFRSRGYPLVAPTWQPEIPICCR